MFWREQPIINLISYGRNKSNGSDFYALAYSTSHEILKTPFKAVYYHLADFYESKIRVNLIKLLTQDTLIHLNYG